ncbi:ABC transporter permease [uncultured Corynebacterium sp.]|uniref:ABC transporter permease n=1 Tax=uncultured Corynebacterium sp. TaxID=159447 RepID=UPI002605623F|nr:ABC transporter permease [uncultured Corynebacterium sp.]
MSERKPEYLDKSLEPPLPPASALNNPTGDFSPHSDPTNQAGVTAAVEDEMDDIRRVEAQQNPNTPVSDHSVAKPMKKSTLYFRRFTRNKPAVVGFFVLVILLLFAIFGKFLTPWSYDDPDFLSLAVPPNSEHYFGTTSAGNDLFAMAVHGLGRSMIIASAVSIATIVIAAVVGTTAALLGGTAEKIILTLIHFLLVIPSFLLIGLMVSGSGGDWKILTIVLIAFGWMFSARVIWSMSISVREREFIAAARYMGVPTWKIVMRHMIPNIASLLAIYLTLGVVSAVMSETGLSFLGLGVKIPDVSLGTLLANGANNVEASPWEFFFPAGILTMLTVSVAFFADGLRDALDPNSAAGGKA